MEVSSASLSLSDSTFQINETNLKKEKKFQLASTNSVG